MLQVMTASTLDDFVKASDADLQKEDERQEEKRVHNKVVRNKAAIARAAACEAEVKRVLAANVSADDAPAALLLMKQERRAQQRASVRTRAGSRA